MLTPLAAIIPDIRTALGDTPLYTQKSRLNREAPPPPYVLLLPISQPADPDAFDSVLVAGLDIWGPLWRVSEIADSLSWLEDRYEGRHEDAGKIRYSFQGQTWTQEPEATMPDGVTELWHLSATLRIRYVNLTRLEAPP